MITGAQKKVLLTQDENGNLKLDENMKELFFGKNNYKLVRQRDGLTKESNDVLWVEFNEDGTFKEKYDEPSVGRSLLMSPFNTSFTWLTTPLTKILEMSETLIKFDTENSTYELYKVDE